MMISSGGTVEVVSAANHVEIGTHLDYVEIVQNVASGGIPYTGEYEATPTWSEQVFATNGLKMTDDFTVHSMLELEVINDAGGLTLTI